MRKWKREGGRGGGEGGGRKEGREGGWRGINRWRGGGDVMVACRVPKCVTCCGKERIGRKGDVEEGGERGREEVQTE